MAHLFNPFPKQEEFLEAVFSNDYDFVLYGGAIRGGKTFSMLGLFILLCRLYGGSRWAIVRKDLPKIKINVLPVFYKVCPPEFIKTKPSQYNQWTAQFTNGSEIIFFPESIDTDKELDRFKGLEVCGIGYEEMDISEKGFNKGLERVGTWNMGEYMADKKAGKPTPPTFACGTCNPSHGWVKKRFFDKWKDGTLEKFYKYIPSKVFDNPFIPKEWIETKRRIMTPLNFKKFVEGDWEINENEHPFFMEYSDELHVINEKIPLRPLEKVWFSFDFNIHPCTCVVGQKIIGEGLFINRVIQIDGGTERLCESLGFGKSFMLAVTGDNSGHSGSTAAGTLPTGQLNNDFEIIKRVLNVSDRQLVNTQTANGQHKHSRDLCNSVFYRIPVTISKPDCEALILDLQTGQPNNRGGLLKDRDSHKQDAGDAFRYLINAWFPHGQKDVNKFADMIL